MNIRCSIYIQEGSSKSFCTLKRKKKQLYVYTYGCMYIYMYKIKNKIKSIRAETILGEKPDWV